MIEAAEAVRAKLHRSSAPGRAQALLARATVEYGVSHHPDGDSCFTAAIGVMGPWMGITIHAGYPHNLVKWRTQGEVLPLSVVSWRREVHGHDVAKAVIAKYLREAGATSVRSAARLLLEELPLLQLVAPGSVLTARGGMSTPCPWIPLLEFYAEAP